MTEFTSPVQLPRSFWIIAFVALLWNLIGIMTYLMSVTITPEALSAMPESERSLYSDIPLWVTSSYAVAVFGGTLACLGLLLRKAWAVPVFGLSLLGILLQMSHAFFLTPMLEIQGMAAAVLPIVIIVVAAYLVWFAYGAQQRAWLN